MKSKLFKNYIFKTFYVFYFILGSSLAWSQSGIIDNTFIIGSGLNTEVYKSTIQPDDKIIVCGTFSSYNGNSTNKIARINSDGSIDQNFVTGSGFDNALLTVTLQNDGKILAGGLFSSYNGSAFNKIIRLNPNGTIDNSFIIGSGISDPTGWVKVIAVQPDGKILIGGTFTTYNGSAKNRLLRINSDGSIDNSFDVGSGFNISVDALSILSDGKIIAAGGFTTYNGSSVNRIIKLNSNGTRDLSFNVGAGFSSSWVYGIKVQPDGKVIATGGFTSYNGTSRNRIARLNSNGSIDLDFNPGTGFSSGEGYEVSYLSSGKILIAGGFGSSTTYNGSVFQGIIRLNQNGSVDNAYILGSPYFGGINSFSLQNDDKIVIVGNFATTFEGVVYKNIARLNNSCVLSSSVDIQNHCQSYTWMNGITYDTNNNAATYTLTNSSGCDSIITLNLTINSLDTSVIQSFNSIISNATDVNYQWLNCDNNYSEIPAATQQSFTPSQFGNYAVRISNSNCLDTSACINFIGTKIKDYTNTICEVYPNPSNGSFIVKSNSSGTYNLFNSYGQLVKSIDLNSNQHFQQSIENLFAGVYFLTSNNFSYKKKIVVVK